MSVFLGGNDFNSSSDLLRDGVVVDTLELSAQEVQR